MSSGRLQELKNNRKSLNFQAQKVVAVAYRRWSFTRGSNCKALTGKILVFWIGGRLWEVVAHGGSTVYARQRSRDYHYYQYTRPNRTNVFHKERLFNMKSCCGLQIPFTDYTLPLGPRKGAF